MGLHAPISAVGFPRCGQQGCGTWRVPNLYRSASWLEAINTITRLSRGVTICLATSQLLGKWQQSGSEGSTALPVTHLGHDVVLQRKGV